MTNSIPKQGCERALRPFVHLHTHTEYSQLDGIAKVEELVDKAIADGMPGIAITDHANMFGIKQFINCVNRKNKEQNIQFKPIIGCEFYVARRGMEHKDEREDFAGYHLILLAKNYTGYKNLLKLNSRAWVDGFCGRARTDKADLERYHEGLICCSACIGGEVAQHILNDRLAEAEETVKWHKELFGEDYYLELQRHKATAKRANHNLIELEERVNNELISLAKRHNIKLVCTNDIHFVNEADAEAHDTFLCMTWSKKYDEEGRLVFSKQEWMKTTEEMNALFADIPEALDSTVEILNKVEHYSIDHAPILPQVALPEDVDSEVEYLARLAFEGAHKRFGEVLPEEVKERLKQELKMINTKSYPAYFLLWHEIISKARELGAWIGPGRGSVGCSLVAYCLGITQINPLEWGLPFERLLNLERSPLPDIDVDLDEYGRERVVEWMREHYGTNRVSNITSLGSYSSNSNKQLVAQVYNQGVETMNSHTRAIAERLDKVLRFTTPHACGVAICGDDLSDWVPMAYIFDKRIADRVVATQYEGSIIDETGVIKLDILSLRHLDAIKRAVEHIRQKEADFDIDAIPADDAKTFELLRKCETVGVFHFEAKTMQESLREVQPTTMEELVVAYEKYCKAHPHAICYTLLIYQTAYLKAHYPAEYMEALCYCFRHEEWRFDIYNEERKRMGLAL